MNAHRVKRTTDVVLACALLVLLAPVLAFAAVGTLVATGRPILFRQVRPGLHGVPFTLCKFRSMRPTRPGEPFWDSDELRLTAFGRLLRRTSIDELPQLFQVVSGEMSLVGPRPLLMEYLPRYSAWHARRHEVRPGITGLAQVSGRSALTLGQTLDLDVEYVDTWSPLLDLKILLRTLAAPFRPGYIPGLSVHDRDDVRLMSAPLERVE
ncbi:sugar transferase [Micromonospora okii]|uniref:sugar transferase n=1 Tax=Micromonospora okii TaxID=1182970 RepID=UPI001E3E49F7|nr:sugar transferase [Micromonospora okii]